MTDPPTKPQGKRFDDMQRSGRWKVVDVGRIGSLAAARQC